MLVRLLYASRAVQGMDKAMLDAIVDRSQSSNPEHGITGILCAYPEGGLFLQALEGGREEVNALYNNIVRDPRHENVTLLRYEDIEERRFSSWRMGRVDLKSVNPGVILRFSRTAKLDPFSMTAVGAHAFLEELASTAAIGSRERG